VALKPIDEKISLATLGDLKPSGRLYFEPKSYF
jgi:hypothetical protein